MTPADREAPRVWHHGLVARWWAEFNVGGPEVEHFGARLRELGGPTLDVGCGSGRLLVPFVKAGLEVEGCDVSADMLARCRARAGAEGVSVTLHRQAAQELDLPRRYRSAIMCGVLGLGSVRAHDQEALRRVYAHLEPGGTLLLDHHLPYASEEEWRYWTSAGQRELPLPWPAAGERRVAADGDELELTTRLVALDPLAQARHARGAGASVARRRAGGARGTLAPGAALPRERGAGDAPGGRLRAGDGGRGLQRRARHAG